MTAAASVTTAAPITPGARPARLVAATALLAGLGAIGLFAPIGVVAVVSLAFGALTSGSFGSLGQLALAWGVLALPWTPLVCVVALVAAAGLYRGRRWGLLLGRVVGLLLIAGALYRVVTWVDQSEALDGPVRIAVGLIGHHLFLSPPLDLQLLPGGIGITTVIAVSLGLIVLGGLARPHPGAEVVADASPRASAGVPRAGARLGIATAVLIVLAIDALIPLAILVGAMVFPWRIGGGFTAAGPDGTSDHSIVTGAALLLVGLPSITAMALALLGARAIRRRSPVAPYLAPATTAVGALWATPWLLALGILIVSAVASGADVDASLGLVLVVAAVGLPVAALLFVGWATISSRGYFPPPTAAPVVPLPRRSQVRAVGIMAAVGVALVVLLPGNQPDFVDDFVGDCVEDKCPGMETATAWVGDQRFWSHGPVAASPEDLEPFVELDDWTSDLPIADPLTLSVVGIEPGRAVLVQSADAFERDGRPFDYLLLVSETADDFEFTGEACAALTFEESGYPGGMCGPPELIRVGDREYWGSTGFEVPSTSLRATGESAVGESKVAPEADFDVHAIEGVDPADAVAILYGDRVVVYLADPGETRELPETLCAYAQEPSDGVGEIVDECRS